MKVKSYIKSGYVSKPAMKGDDNACVPVAIANAFNLTIEESTSMCAIAGREMGKGMHIYKFHPIIQRLGGKFVGFFGTTKNTQWNKARLENKTNEEYKTFKGCTLKTFIENNQKGRYIIVVTGHATFVNNSVLVDRCGTIEGSKSVIAAWKVD